jgi:TolB-like protein
VSFVVIIGLVVVNVMGGEKKLRAGDIQSLVILPFENYTGDDQMEWLVSGLHSQLIGDVQRISGFDVIGKTTSKVYKDAGMTLQEIALERDVDALIEADLMCHGDTICFQLRLIRAFPEEITLWSEEYREAKGQIQNLYNRITKQIADEVKIELTTGEEALLAETITIDPEA